MPKPKLMRPPMLLVPMLLAVTGCVTSPPIFAPTSRCSELVPAEWREGVGHAPAPAQLIDALAQLKAWIGFGTAEAAKVEAANGRTRDTLGIIERCEKRDATAIKASRPKFLGLL